MTALFSMPCNGCGMRFVGPSGALLCSTCGSRGRSLLEPWPSAGMRYQGDWFCAECNRNVGPVVGGVIPDCVCGKTSARVTAPPPPRDWRLPTSKQISDAAIAAEEGRGAPEKVMTTDAERAADECDRLRFETAKRDVDDLRACVAKYRAALGLLGARNESVIAEVHAVKRERDELLLENARMRRKIEAMERKERKR